VSLTLAGCKSLGALLLFKHDTVALPLLICLTVGVGVTAGQRAACLRMSSSLRALELLGRCVFIQHAVMCRQYITVMRELMSSMLFVLALSCGTAVFLSVYAMGGRKINAEPAGTLALCCSIECPMSTARSQPLRLHETPLPSAHFVFDAPVVYQDHRLRPRRFTCLILL
jgi:hypothetical protein